MQAKKRFLLLWVMVLFVLVVSLLKIARKPDSLLRLADNVDDEENSPSFMDNWQPSLEVGRPPAAKTYEERQQMPFHASHRKTNKNCR